MTVLAVLAAVSVVGYGHLASRSRAASAMSTAVAIRNAITAAAAERDQSANETLASLWSQTGNDTGALLDALGVDFHGIVTFIPGTPGRDTTMTVSTLAGGSRSGACIAVPPGDLPAVAQPCAGAAEGTLQQIASVTDGTRAQALAWSPNGSTFTVAYEGSNNVSVFRVAGDSVTLLQHVLVPAGSGPVAARYSPNGALFAIANWNTASVSLFRVNSDGTLGARTDYPTGSRPFDVAFSPDGATFVAMTNGAAVLNVFTVETSGALTAKAVYPTLGGPLRMEFNPVGTSLAVTAPSSGKVMTFPVNGDGTLGTRIDTALTAGGPNGIAYSPDGARVAVANGGANKVSTLPVLSGGTISSTEAGSGPLPSPYGVDFSHDGRLVASSGLGAVQLFTVAAGGQMVPKGSAPLPASQARAVRFSPDGTKVAVGVDTLSSNNVFVFDVG